MKRIALMLAALALLVSPAQAHQERSLEAEVARVLRLAAAQAPFGAWDDLRAAMPRSVRWHLVPPDAHDAHIFRRTGWIELAGRQAGVAACGPRVMPELLTLRIDGTDESVLSILRESFDLRAVDPRWLEEGEERYRLNAPGDAEQILSRAVACTPEGARASRRCSTSYTLTIRPPHRDAPAARECRAP